MKVRSAERGVKLLMDFRSKKGGRTVGSEKGKVEERKVPKKSPPQVAKTTVTSPAAVPVIRVNLFDA